MTHEEFNGVTLNDLDLSGTQISRSSKFSVINIPHTAHIFTRTWPHDVPVFAIANPCVCHLPGCRLSVLNIRAPYSGGWSFRWYFFTTVYLLSHPLASVQNSTRLSQEEPLHWRH